MSKAEIDQLKAEAGIDQAALSPSPWSAEAGQAAEGDSQDAEHAPGTTEAYSEQPPFPEASPPEIDRAGLVVLVNQAVAALAAPICKRAKVTALDPSETMRLAGALTDLAIAYDVFGRTDPKTLAWLSLAAVVTGLAANRERIGDAPAQAAPSQAAGPAPADQAPSFPLDGAQSYSGA